MDRGHQLSPLISVKDLICPLGRRTIIALLHLTAVLRQKQSPGLDCTAKRTYKQVVNSSSSYMTVWVRTSWSNSDASERIPVAQLLRLFVADEDH